VSKHDIVELDELDPHTGSTGELAQAIINARANNKPVIFFLGGHVIKSGMTRVIQAFIEAGLVTHIACNGAVLIHDMELATFGATSEDVRKYIKHGDFGLWGGTHMGWNDIMNTVEDMQVGIGFSAGVRLGKERNAKDSIFVTARNYQVTATVHPLIGGDVVCGEYYRPGIVGHGGFGDFAYFANSISKLHEGGVFCNIGSAVHGPEVYLKALSIARNIHWYEKQELITDFTTGVFDIVPLPKRWQDGEPAKDDPAYYFRPLKTILLRTVADGGKSHYVQGLHQHTISGLWTTIQNLKENT
jgi:hypothetical protein